MGIPRHLKIEAIFRLALCKSEANRGDPSDHQCEHRNPGTHLRGAVLLAAAVAKRAKKAAVAACYSPL